MPAPIVLLNCVGLTPRLLPLAPRLSTLATSGWLANMPEVLPAVTCTAQATLLTGTSPSVHGIVANGWLFRETGEIRFWQQSNRLILAEPVYATLQRIHPRFKVAKLFWWFNQGAAVDLSVTPKPWYGIDGDKIFDIATTPIDLGSKLKSRHGPFPFPAFWGPMAGLASTRWIADAAASVIRDEHPDLTLVYMPHLDYDPQRFGPSGTDMARCVRQLDDCCEPILDAATAIGAQVWVVSEYGHCDVSTSIMINRTLRTAGLLTVRDGPLGEQLDVLGSHAFAVVDHQLAHIYTDNVPRTLDVLAAVPGIDRCYSGDERAMIGLDHPRSGEIIVLAKPSHWFAYNFWLDDRRAPDYARCVAIHHKPGFDPSEMLFDPALRWPKLHAARRLIQKKLGFRTRFDVVPLDPSGVRGSHGLAAVDPMDRPILIGHGPCPGLSLPMTAFKQLLIDHFASAV
jgi:predicted AlkP superfamily pyrophosphatase or phosphodiesterase